MKPTLRIVFMGTPDFAVPSLNILVDAGYDVAAVVTAPDKPSGRGLAIHESPIKQYATAHHIPVLQPSLLKDPAFIAALEAIGANLFVVVAFRMLPQAVWQMPVLGTFNLHASLLPDYRGAAPINWAVINGETKTGATTFFLKHEIDTGDIIMQETMAIGPDEDTGSVHDRLMETGAALVLKTVDAIANGAVPTYPQRQSAIPKTAPKIFKEDCKIDWQKKNLDQLHNFVRGLSPYPAAWMVLDGKVLRVFKTSKEPTANQEPPGTIISDHKTYIKIATMGGYLHLLEVQLEGKKKMGIQDFLKGFRMKDGGVNGEK